MSYIQGFHKHTRLEILASGAFLRENKRKINNKILPSLGIEPGTSAICCSLFWACLAFANYGFLDATASRGERLLWSLWCLSVKTFSPQKKKFAGIQKNPKLEHVSAHSEQLFFTPPPNEKKNCRISKIPNSEQLLFFDPLLLIYLITHKFKRRVTMLISILVLNRLLFLHHYSWLCMIW